MLARSLPRILTITCLLAIMALSATPLGANGVPVKIILTYLTGYSNWGPAGAAGVADISVREGDARITATGLPQLPEDTYEGWLVNTKTGDTFSVGKFNADGNGKIDYQASFEQIPDLHYDFFIISVEPKNDPDAAADGRKSIAGFYPVPRAEQGPAELPKTGDDTPAQGSTATMAVAGGALIALCLGVLVGRWSKARSNSEM